MKRAIMSGILAMVVGLSGLMAQKVKSKGEGEAINAVLTATTLDDRIKNADAALTKYADTEFKAILMNLIAASYQQKGDADDAIIYAERCLKEADPKSYEAMLILAETTVQRTKEFDLDKEEKLSKAEKYANSALEALQSAPRFVLIREEQWPAYKAQQAARAHEVLGSAAMARKKYDVAIAEYKSSNDTSPDAASLYRMAAAYDAAGKYDEGIAILDKLMAQSDVNPTIRQYAQAERVRAMQGKGALKPATPPAAAPAATPATPAPKP